MLKWLNRKSIKSLNSGFSNYSDWKLPGSDDFNLIKDFVKKTSLVSINSDDFWIYGADLNSDLSDYNVRNALFIRKYIKYK